MGKAIDWPANLQALGRGKARQWSHVPSGVPYEAELLETKKASLPGGYLAGNVRYTAENVARPEKAVGTGIEGNNETTARPLQVQSRRRAVLRSMGHQTSDKGGGMREANENAQKRHTIDLQNLARYAGRERRLDERKNPLQPNRPPQTTPLDQSKRGLQDDHDPSDVGQRSANQTGGVQYQPREKNDPKNPKPEE
jgi:hypothetical protein